MNKAILVAGLGFGDEGKGTTTEWLCKKYAAKLVVRYNGGAQAAHNVVTDDGRHHTFSQWGSGTFLGVPTYLSRFMLIDPLAMEAEGKHLEELGINPWALLKVDVDCPVITPYHLAVNRIKEGNRTSPHGTCGIGVGECVSDVLEFGRNNVVTMGYISLAASGPNITPLFYWLKETQKRQLAKVKDMFVPEFCKKWLNYDPELLAQQYTDFLSKHREIIPWEHYFSDMARKGNMVFEGAQGVLLDETYGFHPHTTWSDTTYGNALALLKFIDYTGKIERWGVTRTYSTRHGAGPMPGENKEWGSFGEKHNTLNNQGVFRTGPLNVALLNYATWALGQFDYLAVTHVDKFPNGLIPAVDHPMDLDLKPPTLEQQEQFGNYLNSLPKGKIHSFNFTLTPPTLLHDYKIGMLSRGPCLKDKEDLTSNVH
jgi:adenylosuccinate synthase